MKVTVVGATGLVGSKMVELLEKRNFPVSELIPVASEKSIGKVISFNGKKFSIVDCNTALNLKPRIALFSAGATISKQWAKKFAENNTSVIDNSSAWRMNADIKLIVPEINAHILTKNDKIIANPNCSTIQMVMILAPLHRKYRIKRIVVSTYQSVTGTGYKAIQQMENERNGIAGEMVYPYRIDKNCFPHGGKFLENGYTTEEMKLVNETQKILDDYRIQISATVVRIPVTGGHSEAVNVEFYKDFELNEVKNILSKTKGVVVMDDISKNVYPMPILAEGKDEVFVGRIRRDYSNPNSLNLWIVSDNLRKGAATNAVQIAGYIIENNLI